MRSPNIGQLIAVLAATIALFFMISFVGKSLQVHRLRVLQERLVAEQRLLMRERDELQQEVERRKSGLWAEELLRGQLRVGAAWWGAGYSRHCHTRSGKPAQAASFPSQRPGRACGVHDV